MDESKLTLAQNADQTQSQAAESAVEVAGGRELSEEEKVEKLKHELSLAQNEYQEAMAKIQEAEASGATKSSVAWLRSRAKKIGTKLSDVSHELYWSHNQETAPQEPTAENLRAELDQFVYEVNSLYEQNTERIAAGESMGDVVEEQERRRMRTGIKLLEAAQQDPDLVLETASAIKWNELAEDIAHNGMQQLELDKPGEGRKKYADFLRSRGMGAVDVENQLAVFDNGMDYARQRQKERQMSKMLDSGDVKSAVLEYFKDDGAEYFSYQGKRMAEIAVEYLGKLIEQDLQQGVALYRQMPDVKAYEMRKIENLLHAKAEQMVAGFVTWEERKYRMMALLAGAPEALVEDAGGYHSSANWTTEERQEILHGIVKNHGHDSVISRFSASDVDAQNNEESKSVLFKAYLGHKPEKIIESIGVFRSQYEALSEEEQARVKSDYVKGSGKYYLTSRLQDVQLTHKEFEEYVLSEGRTREDLIASLESHNPLALLVKCNADNLAVDQGKKSEIVARLIDRKPFKLLENMSSLDLNPEQKVALHKNLVSRLAELLGRSSKEIVGYFGGDENDTAGQLANMGSYSNDLLSISNMLGKQDFDRYVGAEGDKAKAHGEALTSLEGLHLPRNLFSLLAANMLRSPDPKEYAAATAQGAQKILDQEIGAIKLVCEKNPNMAEKLLIGSPEDRASFVRRYRMCKEYAPYLFRRLPSTAFEKIFTYDEGRAKVYLEVFQKIQNAPSQEIQKVNEQLADQISASEDPMGKYEQVMAVFVRNNLPTVGKAFKVFELLHPSAELDKKLQNKNLSPTLRAERQRGRMLTIYKDLLNAHVESGNASLKRYLEVLQQGEDIMAVADNAGVDSLDQGQKKSLRSFLDKLNTLYENSMLGRVGGADRTSVATGDLKEEYESWRQSVGAKPGQLAVDRVAEMFFKPLGFDDVDQVLARMEQAKIEAGKRNEELAANGQLKLVEGDLLKGVDARFLGNIMQNGSVAKEFLGASSDSDATPLDTDLGRVTQEDGALPFAEALAASPAMGYGEVTLLVKNRGQFQETSSASDVEDLRKQAHQRKPVLELFRTGAIDSTRHYGVRTGFPMTQVDAMVAGELITKDSSKLDSLCMQIVQNGFYIPVADKSGKILFTPENYREFREKFNVGLERLGGKSFELQQPSFEVSPKHKQEIEAIKLAGRHEREAIRAATEKIKDTIFGIMEGLGINTFSGDENVAVKPEFIDSGSSGRGTSIPGPYDFDFVLKLNPQDMIKSVEIQNELVKALDATDNGSHHGQLRLKDGKLPGIGQKLEIDVAFVSKSDLAVYESHDASKERLDAMPDEVREEVRANIVLAKQILKEAGVYKKTEGGLGGIGLENLILQNGGNVALAFQRFDQMAHVGENLVPFAEFKQKFKIIDPGINAKFGKHDNFVEENMNEEGYRRMAGAVKEYLRRIQPKNMQEAAA